MIKQRDITKFKHVIQSGRCIENHYLAVTVLDAAAILASDGMSLSSGMWRYDMFCNVYFIWKRKVHFLDLSHGCMIRIKHGDSSFGIYLSAQIYLAKLYKIIDFHLPIFHILQLIERVNV